MENRGDKGAETGDELAGGGVDKEDDEQGGLGYGDGWSTARTSGQR